VCVTFPTGQVLLNVIDFSGIIITQLWATVRNGRRGRRRGRM